MPPQTLLVLDGGLGHLLKDMGVQVPGLPYEQQFLAGALANEADPDTVRRVHEAYMGVGTQVCTTNNFACTQHNLSKVHRAADVAQLCHVRAQQFQGMLAACATGQRKELRAAQAAGRIARRAVDASSRSDALVAGCLPPLMESYQTRRLPPQEAMQLQYADIAAALLPHVDIFLAETLSTSAEAAAAVSATTALGKPLWVSFTLEDSQRGVLRSQEPLADAVQTLVGHQHVQAVLLNCCAPAAVTAALPLLHATATLQDWRIGAYANGFRTTTTQWLAGDAAPRLPHDAGDYDGSGLITPVAYLRHAQQWRQLGASIIGGCCGVGPEHIRAVTCNVT